MGHISKDQTVQYTLTMIDDILQVGNIEVCSSYVKLNLLLIYIYIYIYDTSI